MFEDCFCDDPNCYECSLINTVRYVEDPDVVAYFTHELSIFRALYPMCGPTMEFAVEINMEE